MRADAKLRFDLTVCKRHSDVMGRVAGAEAHQHTSLLVRARGFDRLANIAGICHTLSSDFQNHVALLEPAIRGRALRIDFHDNDAFLACSINLACRCDRHAQSRNVRAEGGTFTISIDVSLGFLSIWQLTKRETDDRALALMHHVQLGSAARRVATDDAGQFPGIPDRLTIDRGNDVACFNAGLCCRSILLGISYQRALRLLQTDAVGDILGYRLNLNADPTAADASLVLELSDHVLYRRCRDRKCDADAATGWRIDRSVYADDLALHIEGRATRITLVDGGVDLNEIVVWTASDVTAAGRNDAGRYGTTQTKRVAYRKHPIADAGLAFR